MEEYIYLFSVDGKLYEIKKGGSAIEGDTVITSDGTTGKVLKTEFVHQDILKFMYSLGIEIMGEIVGTVSFFE